MDMAKKIKIRSQYGLPSIDGMYCTFETRKIRKVIEDMFEVNKEFNLPKKYTYEIKHSETQGYIAKIKLR